MTNEYTVQVGQVGSPSSSARDAKPCQVLVEQLQAERYRVVIDGVETVVSARKVEAAGASATWSLLDETSAEQRVVDVDSADGGRGEWRVTVGRGDAVWLAVADLRDRRTGGSQSAGDRAAGELRAAMPGKVVKLLCKPGDEVKPGQSLLVIEAMKMENELRAPSGGRVTEIAAREGLTVEAGQLLVAISAGPGGDPEAGLRARSGSR